MKILIVAGEISGDRFAAQLVQDLKQHSQSSLSIAAIGGEQLKAVSDTFYELDFSKQTIGLQPTPHRDKVLEVLSKVLKTHKPDAAVIVDCPNDNVVFGEFLKSRGIPVFSYIVPNDWIIEKTKRIQKIAAFSRKIYCVFKPEYEKVKLFTEKAVFVGHPFLTHLPPLSRTPDTPPIIGLMPGSRDQEIENLLPEMLKTMAIIRKENPKIQFRILAATPKIYMKIVEVANRNVLALPAFWQGSKDQFFQSVSAVLSATGTVTLECCIHRIPMVVVGGLHWFVYILAVHILRVKRPVFLALPNILAGEEVVPEFFQFEMKAASIVPVLMKMLQPNESEQVIRGYEKVFEAMGKNQNTVVLSTDILNSISLG